MELEYLVNPDNSWIALAFVNFALFVILFLTDVFFTSIVFLGLCGVCIFKYYSKKYPDNAVSKLLSNLEA
jgi:hypothetical protein